MASMVVSTGCQASLSSPEENKGVLRRGLPVQERVFPVMLSSVACSVERSDRPSILQTLLH